MKKQIIDACLKTLDGRITDVRLELQKLKEDLGAETKSSMGDKYETSREMMTQERGKLSERLDNLQKQRAAFGLLDEEAHQVIKNGSMVQTNIATYLIVTAFGSIDVEGRKVFVISQAAPLAQELMGKKEGSKISLNGRTQVILAVS